MENTRAFPACSRLSNILLGRARLEIELCPLIEMINCLTSAAVPLARRAAPDCLFTNRKYENVRNRAHRTGGSGLNDGKRGARDSHASERA